MCISNGKAVLHADPGVMLIMILKSYVMCCRAKSHIALRCPLAHCTLLHHDEARLTIAHDLDYVVKHIIILCISTTAYK